VFALLCEEALVSDFGMVDRAPAVRGKDRVRGLDPLVRYIIFHWALGGLGGALCVTALLIFDPFGLWPLIHDSGLGLPAIFLLYVGFMTSAGGLVCAAAVMFPPKDDPPRGGLRRNATRANWKPSPGYARAARRF
jgi:hypothetical protein